MVSIRVSVKAVPECDECTSELVCSLVSEFVREAACIGSVE